jgi:MYXO-CTERM domain-containing protein
MKPAAAMRTPPVVAVTLCLAAVAPPARATNRIVAEATSTKPLPGTEESILFVRRTDVMIGECPPVDAATGPIDAAPAPDANPGPGPDADPGAGPDADPGPPPCEVIPGDAVTMVVQPRFGTGAAEARFAILLVTPSDPIVEVEDPGLFAQLEDVTAPEVDVREVYVQDPALGKRCGSTSRGCGSFDSYDPPAWDPPPVDGEGTPPIETVGPYEVARSRPADRAALAAWLDELGYIYAPIDVDAVAPYLALGYTVLAVRVVATAQFDGGLQPIALTWAGTELRVPLGLARRAEPASVALTVFVAAEGRYELPGAIVPFAQRTAWAGDSRFLTRNDRVVDLEAVTADADPVLDRIVGDPTYHERVEIVEEVRVPVDDCSDELDFDIGCCRIGGGPPGAQTPLLAAVAVVLVVLRRRRRR